MGFMDECLAEVVRSGMVNHRDEEDKYGVFLNEFDALKPDKDVFDAAEDTGPSPPIMEEADKIYEVCSVETPEGPLIINQMAYNMILPTYTVAIYGPRRSGKSKLIRNICQRLRPFFPEVLVFTKTKSSCEYHQFMPDTCIIDGFSEALLEQIMQDQAAKKRAESRGEDMGNYHMLIILDDCMADDMRFKKTFNKVFFNGRHYNITMIVTMQDVKGIAPAATLNTDLCIAFCMPDRRGRDTLREKFADYLSRDQFDAIMDSKECNKKYHVVAFDVSHRYNCIDKRVYVGCVDEEAEEPFVMGDRKLWQYDLNQLKQLGFEHLIAQEDWGIISK